jgi:hypothetical protein
MSLHTTRLILTVIFFIFALAGLISGYWFQALFWALITIAVGAPFVRNGRIDLYYDDAPTKVIIYQPVVTSPGVVATPLPGVQPTAAMPAAVQQLIQGEI